MTDAASAIARILRAPPSTDPDVLAAHILTALRGHGWRPTVAAAPVPPPSKPLPPEQVRAIAARARQAITTREGDREP